MCGIIGYLGPRAAEPILLESLQRLEYRGYDSAGIAVLDDHGAPTSVKCEGKVAALLERLDGRSLPGQVGMGHTRWATHGRPSETNAHPHTDCDGRFYVIHNGIIENFQELREELLAAGHRFISEADTEVIPHLIEQAYAGDLVDATRTALGRLRGAFAVVVLGSTDPDTLIGARLNAPLVVGVGEREWFLCSDIPAILPYTRQVLVLGEGEMAVISPVGPVISTIADGTEIEPRVIRVEWDVLAAQKGGFSTFMRKEMDEQPAAVENALRGRLLDSGEIRFPDWSPDPALVAGWTRLRIVGAGSAYYAGLVAKYAIEELAQIPVEVETASEFRYRPTLVDPHTLTVAISQSGETADTLAAARESRARGSHVVALTNVVASSLALEADGVINLHAGPEIGVVATKTFVTQAVCGILLGLHLAWRSGSIDPDMARLVVAGLRAVAAAQRAVLAGADRLAVLGGVLADHPAVLFIGRGINYPTALEGALKLKEISYQHAEGYPAGELKHGPIALLDQSMPVVAFATAGRTREKMRSNIEQVRARQSPVIAIVSAGDDSLRGVATEVISVPEVPELVSPLVNVVVAQFLAYHAALVRGCDVDQPRNLAKSVTVE